MTTDEIRSRFARAISRMYQDEVPQYGTLLRLVANVNEATLAADPTSRTRLSQAGELYRIDLERHGAIRLGFFRYVSRHDSLPDLPLEDLVRSGRVTAYPIVYEDFLPVSAAGIFQSNLGSWTRHNYRAGANREAFVAALGCEPLDEFALYAEAERRSIEALPRTIAA